VTLRSRASAAAGQRLERNLYTVFNGLVVPSGGGTTPIDHVVVSKFGIFVIESQYVRAGFPGRVPGAVEAAPAAAFEPFRQPAAPQIACRPKPCSSCWTIR